MFKKLSFSILKGQQKIKEWKNYGTLSDCVSAEKQLVILELIVKREVPVAEDGHKHRLI